MFKSDRYAEMLEWIMVQVEKVGMGLSVEIPYIGLDVSELGPVHVMNCGCANLQVRLQKPVSPRCPTPIISNSEPRTNQNIRFPRENCSDSLTAS
jgi:hypothetical protein